MGMVNSQAVDMVSNPVVRLSLVVMVVRAVVAMGEASPVVMEVPVVVETVGAMVGVSPEDMEVAVGETVEAMVEVVAGTVADMEVKMNSFERPHCSISDEIFYR